MKFLTILAISITLLTASQAMDKPSFHTKGTPTGKPTGTLKPGEYWWKPQLSPSGPVVILVSIPQQTMHVYRNGILVGRSTVSSGKSASTPGVFSAFWKKRKPIIRRNTTTRPCQICSGSPGLVSRCTQVNFPAIPRATAAFVSRMISLSCFLLRCRMAAPSSSAMARSRRRILP
jgi:hypothetical protein